jgi:cholera toxin transcriptional activator
MPAPEPRLLRFGVFEADLRSGELRKSGVKIKLQEQPFQLLAALLKRPGDVVTREELRQRLWPEDTFVDFDHGLNTAINKLREALGDSAASPRFIETLAKRGYRFLAPVQAVEITRAEEILPVPADVPGPPTAAECAVAVAAAEKRAPEHDLPPVHRGLGRSLFALLQVMYLAFYLVSLAKLPRVDGIADRALGGAGWMVAVVVIVSAVVGIPLRLYLFSAVAFDYRRLHEKFRRLFPVLLPLDQLWALSPFLLVEKIGFGLALAATAALLYVPFAQRTLVRMTYSGGE